MFVDICSSPCFNLVQVGTTSTAVTTSTPLKKGLIVDIKI